MALTFVLMDAPYEDARSTTGLRIVHEAILRGHDVNVFAYEGAVALPFALQMPHGNVVHGTDVPGENHPNPKDWIAALMEAARSRGLRLDWVQCGLCVDERGVWASIPGTRRGSPADLHKFVEESANTLVIPAR